MADVSGSTHGKLGKIRIRTTKWGTAELLGRPPVGTVYQLVVSGEIFVSFILKLGSAAVILYWRH